jgi:hypothetical protein
MGLETAGVRPSTPQLQHSMILRGSHNGTNKKKKASINEEEETKGHNKAG